MFLAPLLRVKVDHQGRPTVTGCGCVCAAWLKAAKMLQLSCCPQRHRNLYPKDSLGKETCSRIARDLCTQWEYWAFLWPQPSLMGITFFFLTLLSDSSGLTLLYPPPPHPPPLQDLVWLIPSAVKTWAGKGSVLLESQADFSSASTGPCIGVCPFVLCQDFYIHKSQCSHFSQGMETLNLQLSYQMMWIILLAVGTI